MNISPAEAAEALQEVENSKRAMREMIRSHRGHVFLIIWGLVWVVMAFEGWSGYAPRHPWAYCWISGAGVVASLIVRRRQSRFVRSTFDGRFLGVCGALLAFSVLVWPKLLHASRLSFEEMYAYSVLIWMQLYVVGGILFSRHLLVAGIIVTALVLSGLYLVPALFWPACVLSGLTLIGGGLLIKRTWK